MVMSLDDCPVALGRAAEAGCACGSHWQYWRFEKDFIGEVFGMEKHEHGCICASGDTEILWEHIRAGMQIGVKASSLLLNTFQMCEASR